MTGLHDLIQRSAEAALARQSPEGSLPAGCNGLYGDPETPVRNTAHWLVTFLAVARWSGEPRFRAAAHAAARYLETEKCRPAGGAFWHRSNPRKDPCNGLVGQAWTLEALAEAAGALEAPELSELAETVFLLHPFDARRGLWRRVGIDGRPLCWDATFNHQLWFAAAGALLAPHACLEVTARVARFLDRLHANLALHGSGLIRHALPPRALGWREPRYAIRHLRSRRRRPGQMRHRDAGYHSFNLYAFALLRRHAPDHPFWRGAKFARLWRYARSDGYRTAVDRNDYGWPYNPTGIELAFAIETFEGPAARWEAEAWLAEQMRRHYDFAAHALRRATCDPATLSARLYEASRLPDLGVRAPDRPLGSRQESPQVTPDSTR